MDAVAPGMRATGASDQGAEILTLTVDRKRTSPAEVDAAADASTLDLYARLRDAAHRLMQAEPADHTMQTTALVHEAYLRLIRSDATLAESPARFLAAAGEAMRHALIDHARGRMRLKRGGGVHREFVDLSDLPGLLDADPQQIVALEDALEALGREDELAARVVEMRFHLGLGVSETAAALDISPRTVKRRWAFARTWLFRELTEGPTDPGGEVPR